MKYVPKKLCALITGIDQMIIFEEMCVCGWGGGGGGGGSASTIATDICLTEDWNNNIMCASTAASN